MSPTHAVRKRSRTLLVVLIAAVALCACGVPIDATARVLPQNQLPPALSQIPETTDSSPPVTTGGHYSLVTIYLVEHNLLYVDPGQKVAPLVTPSSLLSLLESGPDVGAEGDGIETDLPVGTHLTILGRQDPLVNVQLDNGYFGQGLPQAELELAQIVFTLTSNNLGLDRVQFWFNGNKVDVEIASGALVTGAVTQCDYASLLPSGTRQPQCKGSSASSGAKPPNG